MGYNRIAGHDINYPLAVYVPNPDDEHQRARLIHRGSGIVGTAYTQFERTDDAPTSILVYFEGNRHGASNIVTWADRCYVAASRMGVDAAQDYPTTALAVLPADSLTPVGTFDGDQVTALGPDEDNLIYQWLDLHRRGNNALDDECLRSRILSIRGKREWYE